MAKKVCINIGGNLYEKVMEYARKNSLNVSEVIRTAIVEFLRGKE